MTDIYTVCKHCSNTDIVTFPSVNTIYFHDKKKQRLIDNYMKKRKLWRKVNVVSKGSLVFYLPQLITLTIKSFLIVINNEAY